MTQHTLGGKEGKILFLTFAYVGRKEAILEIQGAERLDMVEELETKTGTTWQDDRRGYAGKLRITNEQRNCDLEGFPLFLLSPVKGDKATWKTSPALRRSRRCVFVDESLFI